MKKQILGIIKDATQVKQFEKKNGQTNVKCVLHIMAPQLRPEQFRFEDYILQTL